MTIASVQPRTMQRASVAVDVVRAEGSDDVLTFVAATENVGRDGDIVRMNWDLTNFRKNPVFLHGHDRYQLPLGRVERIWTEDREGSPVLMIQVRFAPEDVNPLAQSTLKAYRSGFMHAVSINWRGLEVTRVEDPEERAKLGLGPWGVIFERSELLEVSAVTVPGDPDAVIEERGLDSDEVAGVVESLRGADVSGIDWDATAEALRGMGGEFATDERTEYAFEWVGNAVAPARTDTVDTVTVTTTGAAPIDIAEQIRQAVEAAVAPLREQVRDLADAIDPVGLLDTEQEDDSEDDIGDDEMAAILAELDEPGEGSEEPDLTDDELDEIALALGPDGIGK